MLFIQISYKIIIIADNNKTSMKKIMIIEACVVQCLYIAIGLYFFMAFLYVWFIYYYIIALYEFKYYYIEGMFSDKHDMNVLYNVEL